MRHSPAAGPHGARIRIRRVVLAATVSTILAASAPGQPPVDPPPALALGVSPKVFDLGTVLDAQIVEQSFVVENQSDTPVRIVDVRDTCGGCTAYTLDATELGPGDTALLQLQFDPFGRNGDVDVLVAINTSETNTPQRAIRIVGRVTPAYSLQGAPGRPGTVQAQTVYEGRTHAWEVRVSPNIELRSPLVRAVASQPGFAATVGSSADGAGFTVEITAGPDLEVGNYVALISVDGEDADVPTCRIPIVVRCIPPVEVMPEELVFSPVAAEQLRILFIRPRADPHMRVTGITVPNSRFQYRFLNESGLSWQRVNVYAYSLDETAGFVGDVLVETDLDGGRPIHVPVYVEERSRVVVPK